MKSPFTGTQDDVKKKPRRLSLFTQRKDVPEDVFPLKKGRRGEDDEDGRDVDSDGKSVSSESILSGVNSSTNGDTTANMKSSGSTSGSSEVLARRETIAVNRSKKIVYIALICAAAAVGTATFIFARRGETANFVVAFNRYSGEIVDVAGTNSKSIFALMNSLSQGLTSYSLATDKAWPYVTLPNFDLRTADASTLSGLEFLVFAPIIDKVNTEEWEDFAWTNQTWIRQDYRYREWEYYTSSGPGNITKQIYPWTSDTEGVDDATKITQDVESKFAVPIWQAGPVPTNASIVNLDLNTQPIFRRVIDDVLASRHELVSEALDLSFISDFLPIGNSATNEGNKTIPHNHVRSFIIQPVFDDFFKDSTIVGFIGASLPWDSMFRKILPNGVDGIIVRVDSGACNNEFSYTINGKVADFLGTGKDILDSDQVEKYQKMVKSYDFAEEARFSAETEGDILGVHCSYTITIYPTEYFESHYHTNKPAIYTSVVVLIFLCTVATFFFYDLMVQRRQYKVLRTAERTTKIVQSLFPKNVQQRILEDVAAQVEEEQKGLVGGRKGFFTAKSQLKNYLDENDEKNTADAHDDTGVYKTKPIADLFPDCTIMFADLVGFTAWSSTREPAQVFMLLETVYHAFDEIAKHRRVFKVETVGDCYVAVAGLPEQRKDHATVMARFSSDCLNKMQTLSKQLEVSLGPDTAELGIRIGLHSGPVTAGVLRGERSRFQLFGDTVNTTSRVETTGQGNRIHVSSETAELLTSAGKGHWLKQRQDSVEAKGKGRLHTFWLDIRGDCAASTASSRSSNERGEHIAAHDIRKEKQNDSTALHESSATEGKATFVASEKINRLIDWNKELMVKLLKEIIARREAEGSIPDSPQTLEQMEQMVLRRENTVLDEVKEIITLPKYDPLVAQKQKPAEEIDLSEKVAEQLRDFIQTVAAMYKQNSFHNFEHASHVTMSVVKLLARIIAPDIDSCDDANISSALHDHTYGITSDPLVQFAVTFSAIIHDVDHPGVPNATLVKEKTSTAAAYKNKSVAEQNSVDLAWDLLMDPSYIDFRRTIYTTEAEFKRFRQLVVNTVMATDIMDKDLGQLRKNRWAEAFAEGHSYEDASKAVNRKATIVIEHLIQASDVAHTMQHWHIYRRWNERFFNEMRKAFKDGRSDTDPAESWYKGEIGFFDFYIIPLAKKLKDCGVFGVSSDEYLSYAQKNRAEWEIKGEELVAEMLERDCLLSSPLHK